MDGSFVEQSENRIDASREFSEHGDYWCVNEPKARFVKRYLQGDLGIAFRRNEARSSGETQQDGFVFVVAPDALHSGKEHRQRNLSWPWSDFDKPFMFTQNVELMQGVQMPVTSAIWFQRFDRADFGLRQPLFAFDAFLYPMQIAVKVSRKLPNGKVGILARLHAIPTSERRRKQVERAPHRINDRPDLGVEDGIGITKAIDHQKFAGSLRIRLCDDRIWAFIDIGDGTLFKDWDLGYGPVESGLSV